LEYDDSDSPSRDWENVMAIPTQPRKHSGLSYFQTLWDHFMRWLDGFGQRLNENSVYLLAGYLHPTLARLS
jgi:hypothetical protein